MQTSAEIWRGSVTPWQCDEMGHMNVTFWLAHANEGMAGLAAALGMPRAFTPGASSTLLVREHHVRFLREARTGAGLYMTGAVLDMGETDATLLQTIFHTSGEPAAALTTKVTHVTPRELRPFPWTRATRERAPDLTIEAPSYAAPRSIPGGPPAANASLAEADALGLEIAAVGAIGPGDCDMFGRMLPAQVLARVYSSVGHVFRRSHDALLEAAPELQGRVGGAAVEYRAVYHAWPGAGDRLQLRAGHRALTPKARDVVHWMLDPTSGRPWATAEVVSLFLDLKARKALTLTDDWVKAMGVDALPGLSV